MSIWGNGVLVRDARAVPASDQDFYRGIHQGEWVNLHGTFYMWRGHFEQHPPWQQQRFRVLAVGSQVHRAVLVGKAAAALWGFGLLDDSFLIELAYPGSARPPSKKHWLPDVMYRNSYLPRSHVMLNKGIALTSAARTVVDMCRWYTFAEGLVAAESYLRKQLPRADLDIALAELGRCHGVGKVRRVLEVAGTKSESEAESWAKAQLMETGIDWAKIQQNPELLIAGLHRRPDFLYDGWLVIEIDGQIKYAEDAAGALTKERNRERDFINAGFVLCRATWSDLRTGRFVYLVSEVIARNAKTF